MNYVVFLVGADGVAVKITRYSEVVVRECLEVKVFLTKRIIEKIK